MRRASPVLHEIETIAHEHCITRCTLAGLMSRADPVNAITRKNLSPVSPLAGIPAPLSRDLG